MNAQIVYLTILVGSLLAGLTRLNVSEFEAHIVRKAFH